MSLFALLPFAGGSLSLLLAIARLLRKQLSPAAWGFCAGMLILGTDSLVTGFTLRTTRPEDLARWVTWAYVVKSFAPAAWLTFSLTYSRGDSRDLLARWRVPLLVLAVLPICLAVGFRQSSLHLVPAATAEGGWTLQYSGSARVLNAALLIAFVVVLINLEQTFRAAAGTMRWRIKFVLLALTVIFGTQIFVRSQSILFSTHDVALSGLESGALLIGCMFFAVAYARTGLAEIDVYPSRAVLRSSLTILVVGGYLFVVGVLAQLVKRFGGAELFQLQAFVVLAGMSGLAVLLLSDRARHTLETVAARHFRKAQHDSVRIWALFSRRLARVTDQAGLCAVSAKLLSETFGALSVTIWLMDEETGRLVLGGSTAQDAGGDTSSSPGVKAANFQGESEGLWRRTSAFDLEDLNEPWAAELRILNPSTFTNGGHRICVPLHTGELHLGVVVLADRVSGSAYTPEDFELLKCIADQMTSSLVSLRLAGEVAVGRELEAFRTMSAFFVHDLKNAAASLNLMLQNLPVHFDDPEFRADALRGIGNTATRIDEMISRLSEVRHRPEIVRAEVDLNDVVTQALDRLNGTPDIELERDLHPLPRILVDRDQIQSVVTNLVLNAQDAVGCKGRIRVRTEHRGERVVLSVSDDGCGMSPTFLQKSLFRPFQSTKKKGLGIGLFQSRAIVQRHGGGMQVKSEEGEGTTFLVSLPLRPEK